MPFRAGDKSRGRFVGGGDVGGRFQSGVRPGWRPGALDNFFRRARRAASRRCFQRVITPRRFGEFQSPARRLRHPRRFLWSKCMLAKLSTPASVGMSNERARMTVCDVRAGIGQHQAFQKFPVQGEKLSGRERFGHDDGIGVQLDSRLDRPRRHKPVAAIGSKHPECPAPVRATARCRWPRAFWKNAPRRPQSRPPPCAGVWPPPRASCRRNSTSRAMARCALTSSRFNSLRGRPAAGRNSRD